ncbi:MAG TPA: caspase family protein [Acidimicrobiales bacterium]|nr:caspase family protein [Acidimicrobiales bacterium]
MGPEAGPSTPTVALRRPVPVFDEVALGTRLRLTSTVRDSAIEVASDVGPAPTAPQPDLGVATATTAPPTDVAIVPPPVGGLGGAGGGGGGGGVAASSGPPRERATARSTAYPDATPTGGTWALLIGIDDYPGQEYDLRSAVNDVQDVDEVLRRAGVPRERRMLLRNGQATAGAIRGGLDWLTAHTGADATMIVFYAGHVQKLAPGREALVGADGDTVDDVEVAAMLDRSAAARTWVGIAACYAAGFDEVLRPGRILTAAASANSLAYENATFGRSYLVEYMVRRAMLGGRATSVEAAFARATEELRRDHPDRMPLQFDHLEGDLDLGGPAPAAEPAPPPDRKAPPPSSPPPSSPPPDDGCAGLTLGVVRCEGD